MGKRAEAWLIGLNRWKALIILFQQVSNLWTNCFASTRTYFDFNQFVQFIDLCLWNLHWNQLQMYTPVYLIRVMYIFVREKHFWVHEIFLSKSVSESSINRGRDVLNKNLPSYNWGKNDERKVRRAYLSSSGSANRIKWEVDGEVVGSWRPHLPNFRNQWQDTRHPKRRYKKRTNQKRRSIRRIKQNHL